MPPAKVPAVPVYAGDTCQFPAYTFTSAGVARNFVTENLTNWQATWQPLTAGSVSAMVLTVDSSKAATGILTLLATASQTRLMGGPGLWDLQVTRDTYVETIVESTTTYQHDVTP